MDVLVIIDFNMYEFLNLSEEDIEVTVKFYNDLKNHQTVAQKIENIYKDIFGEQISAYLLNRILQRWATTTSTDLEGIVFKMSNINPRIQKVERYQTEDGSIFETYSEAERYSEAYDIMQDLRNMGITDPSDIKDITTYIIKNFVKRKS